MAVRPAGAGSAGSAAARAAAGSAAVPSASAAGSAAAGSAAAAPGSPASDHILPMFSAVVNPSNTLRSTLRVHPTLSWGCCQYLLKHTNNIFDHTTCPKIGRNQHSVMIFCQTRNFSLPVIRNHQARSVCNLGRQPKIHIRCRVRYRQLRLPDRKS